MMKRIFYTTSLVFAFCFSALSQENERFKSNKDQQKPVQENEATDSSPSLRNRLGISERLIFGGNMSFGFGTNSFVYLAPTVGYKITDQLVAGGGFIYQYSRFTTAFDPNTGAFEPFEFETSVYGPKAFVFYAPIEILYVGTQFEYLNHDVVRDFSTRELSPQWTPVLFLEVGYLQEMGAGMIQFGMKYNVLHDVDSPYGAALIPSVGIFF